MSTTTMPPSQKADPESLDLRVGPRRVVRFKRRLLIGLAAGACAALFGLTWFALSASGLHPHLDPQELLATGRNPTPDELAALPANYGQMRPPPQLGPALPDALGRPVLEQQRELGVAPAPSAEDQAALAERQRRAEQERQARESGVFFRIASRPTAVAASEATPAGAVPVAANAFAPLRDRLALDPEHDPNNQQRKLDFLHQSGEASIYNPHALQRPASPYQVMAGSVIAASLVTGLNSDLPGLAVAQVTENVYDSATGRFLLIPQGTRLIGSYDSVVAFGQSRALLVWQRLVMPDGSSVQIDNLPASDAAGYGGLEDEVDYHTWRLLKGVVLSTLLGVGTEVSLGSNESDLVRAIRRSTQQNASEAGQRLTQRNLDIQPTITVRPGWPLRVIVHKDLVLNPYRG
ncbi:MAG: conjugal transfer protein TrbI [Azospirillum sp.]|nr:conjugal transfer protein TrbI [Azospirillum sp.]